MTFVEQIINYPPQSDWRDVPPGQSMHPWPSAQRQEGDHGRIAPSSAQLPNAPTVPPTGLYQQSPPHGFQNYHTPMNVSSGYRPPVPPPDALFPPRAQFPASFTIQPPQGVIEQPSQSSSWQWFQNSIQSEIDITKTSSADSRQHGYGPLPSPLHHPVEHLQQHQAPSHAPVPLSAAQGPSGSCGQPSLVPSVRQTGTDVPGIDKFSSALPPDLQEPWKELTPSHEKPDLQVTQARSRKSEKVKSPSISG